MNTSASPSVQKVEEVIHRGIPVAEPLLDGRETEYVLECLQTNWISSQGKFITQFESAFAEYCGVRHAIAVNNGTAALHLCLLALGVKAGDEVIVPSLTYVATANAVRYCNATPVFVDNDLRTFNIDANEIAAKITPSTKAIIPVHLYGHPADMDPILEIADKHRLFVVEDAAEAVGARYKDSRAGGIGTCAAFSFFGNKIITTGEGGMVTTNDEAIAARLRMLKGQGMDPDRRYWFPIIGYNYRMTNIAAAIGLAQLEQMSTSRGPSGSRFRLQPPVGAPVGANCAAAIGELGQPCLLDVQHLAARRDREESRRGHTSARRTRHRDAPGILSHACSPALSRCLWRSVPARRILRVARH